MHKINDIAVKDGQIVLSHLPFPDGQHVRVMIEEIASAQPVEVADATEVGNGLAQLAGKAIGLPSDLAERHDHYRRERL